MTERQYGRHAADIEALAERHEQQRAAQLTSDFDNAIRAFDFRYSDIAGNAAALDDARRELQQTARAAAQRGDKVNWMATVCDIGEAIRSKYGLPTTQLDMHESWDDAQISRGRYERE